MVKEWRIRDYDSDLNGTSITKALYPRLGDHFGRRGQQSLKTRNSG